MAFRKQSLGSIKKALASRRADLARDYKIKELGIFGSYVRGEQKKASDVDILVAFSEPIGLFKFMELGENLSALLGTRVDLVSKRALKPRIGERILREVVYV